MPNRDFQRERTVALNAVREAARLCRAVQAGITPATLEKNDHSPVTVADYGSQALVCRALKTAFPDDAIMAEEDAATLRLPAYQAMLEQIVGHVRHVCTEGNGETVCAWIDEGNLADHQARFWTLDPIDGTKGFLRSDQYAVALALIEDGVPVVAALACPNLPIPGRNDRGAIFVAARGQSSQVLPLDGDDVPVPVRVSTLGDPAEAQFCESFVSAHSSHDDAEAIATRLGITRPPLRLDSQAKYGIVARGQADIYLRLPTRAGYVERIWDHAAGALVVEEAGGRVTDVLGKPLAFRFGRGLEQNTGVVVTNGRLHDAVLEAVHAVGAGA